MADVDERQQRLLSALASAASSLHDLVEAERTDAGGGVELLEGVVNYVQAIVEQTDGDLTTESALNAIETHANAIAEDPRATAASSRAYADALLNGVAALPVARDRAVEQAVREAAANFQRSATHRLNAIESEVDGTSTKIRESLAALRSGVETASATSLQEIQAYATAFEAKIGELETMLGAQQQRLDAMIERQSAAFTATQEDRAEAFDGEIAFARSEIATLLAGSTEEIEQHMSEIRRMEEESSGLVHSIGLGGTAERYGDEATAQKAVADTFRRITVALALGAVGMAVFAVMHQVNDNSTVLAKLGVSAVLGGLAAYTAKQSGRHRQREERARNLQLELTAFAPFIEPLDADIKELERVLMTRKTFGNIAALRDGDDGSDHVYGPLGPVLDVIQKRLAARAAGADVSSLE